MFKLKNRVAPEVGDFATREDVENAYRLLLGRKGDPEGVENFQRWIKAEKRTPAALGDRFVASTEYRARIAADAELVPVDMPGYKVFARRGDKLIGASLIGGHAYEPYVVGAFAAALKEGTHVLDVGANIGIFTMLAAKSVGPSGSVVAVEPLPQNHRCLYAGVIHNGYANVQVLPFAASDKAGLVSIRCATDSSNGIVGADEGSKDPTMVVPTHRLQDLLSTLPRLDVVKIDIEGHKPVAWQGMKALLEKHRPSIFTEFSPVASPVAICAT